MIDCHTHLTSHAFDADRAAVLDRATARGVAYMAIVGQDPAENQGVLQAAAADGRLLPFLGLHPDRFADRAPVADEAMVAAVLDMIREAAPRITGIGEVGLDHWVTQDPALREQQHAALRRIVALAEELALPLNVHSRSAGRHAIDLLLQAGATRVLMHAFDGKAGHALRGAEAGYLFSIPPSVVRSPQKRKLIRALPLEALALETDSPVLGPAQGTRNEPANLAISRDAIAEIKGLAPQAVAEQTVANTWRVFGAPPGKAPRED